MGKMINPTGSVAMGKVVQMRLPMKLNGHKIDPFFDRFWDIFPKHSSKMAAQAKWRLITSEWGVDTEVLCKDSGSFVTIHLQADPERIIEGAKRYRQRQIDPTTYRMREGGKYICNPVTWLNGGRWEDEF